MRAILREIIRKVLADAGAPTGWLSPCSRLAWAIWRRSVNDQKGRDLLAAFWGWREDQLRAKCKKLRMRWGDDGVVLCAADLAERAAVALARRAAQR